MAEPEDPDKRAPSHLEFDDDLVGFAHPRALEASSPRAPEPEPEPEPEPVFEPEPEPDPLPEPEPTSNREPEPESFFAATAPVAEPPRQARVEPPVVPPAPPAAESPREPVRESTRELADDYGQPGATRTFDRGSSRPTDPGITSEGDGRLALAIYVCLIGAAPSAGLTLLIALMLAWTARFLIKGWTRSHLLYQLRTSLIGTIAGIIGVLTLPLGLGVFVLSLTLIWVVVRGAAGLYRLMRRQPIRDPQTWSLP